MLVSNVMVISQLTNTQWYFSVEFMECLNEDVKKKKGHSLYIRGRAVQIATGSNLRDTKYKFYGFNDDLRDTFN